MTFYRLLVVRATVAGAERSFGLLRRLELGLGEILLKKAYPSRLALLYRSVDCERAENVGLIARCY